MDIWCVALSAVRCTLDVVLNIKRQVPVTSQSANVKLPVGSNRFNGYPCKDSIEARKALIQVTVTFRSDCHLSPSFVVAAAWKAGRYYEQNHALLSLNLIPMGWTCLSPYTTPVIVT